MGRVTCGVERTFGQMEPEELTDAQVKSLVDASKEAKSMAYNPYSNFRVGAALLTADGKTFTGINYII